MIPNWELLTERKKHSRLREQLDCMTDKEKARVLESMILETISKGHCTEYAAKALGLYEDGKGGK